MLNTLKQLFSLKSNANFAQLVKDGALLLDVRTEKEYKEGHVDRAINIPIQILKENLDRLPDVDRPIVVYCASGVRSGIAKSILQDCGYTRVHNGGACKELQRELDVE